ncbi:MAG: DUF5696 domain-containing protein [Eubacterium sp.]
MRNTFSNYVGMAQAYRQHLIDNKTLTEITPEETAFQLESISLIQIQRRVYSQPAGKRDE